MTEAYANYAKSTLLTTILRRVGSAARLGTNSSFYNFLGSTADNSDQKAEIVQVVNDRVRRLHDKFPLLNVVRTSLATVANQRYVALPATVRQLDVLGVWWDDESTYQNKPIKFISSSEAEFLPLDYRNDAYTQDYPLYVSLAHEQESGSAKLEFWAMPRGAKALTLLYRAIESPFTVTDIATPTVICAIPDDMIECLVYDVAAELQDRALITGSETMTKVEAKRDMLIAEWQLKLARGPLAQFANAVFERGGYPRTHSEQNLWNYSMTALGI